MAAVEAVVLFCCAYLGYLSRNLELPPFSDYFWAATVFALAQVVTMVAMGVYESRVREGYTGMMLRTAVAMFLLGSMFVAILSYFVPNLAMGRGVLMFSIVEGFIVISILRWGSSHLISEDTLKKSVLVLGAGQRALKIATRMRRRADRRAFRLHGFAQIDNGQDAVSAKGGEIVELDCPLPEYCERHNVDEIVVAVDERRRNTDAGGGLPLEELLVCRLSGIEVVDIQAFVEREALYCK